jgi:hypothetical protein
MTKKSPSKIQEPRIWETELLRLTGFPSAASKIEGQTWWKDIAGAVPETRKEKPNKGELQESGQFSGGRLILQIQPTRIDWVHSAIEDPDSDMKFPSLGSFPNSLDRFLKSMLTWLNSASCPQMQRLALGAVLLQPVKDIREAYAKLSSYLGIDIDPNSTDFLYQINRPKDCSAEITGLKLNRLTKWSCASLQLLEVQLDGSSSKQREVGNAQFFCRLELDISSNADFPGDLPQRQLPRIFELSADLGKKLAAKGYNS